MGDEKVLYEWFVCGDDGELPKVYPVMATRAGIEYAVNNGYLMFDFMGAGKPAKNTGCAILKQGLAENSWNMAGFCIFVVRFYILRER